ncbi:MAG: prephenate dehydrogenase [Erysipelotrichaceae bacterium]|nr:prephenate dehydrogenase [Erysipelotrichaceae bacterium]
MKIAIVGLGVVGGSFAKALKGKGHEVYGVDINDTTIAIAKAEGTIIEGYHNGKDIVPECDLTIICLYPSLILDFLRKTTFKPGSVVSDVVGIKSSFLNKALEIVAPDVEYISIHPMAGKEKQGYIYGDAEVFRGANFIIIQHPRNNEEKIRQMALFAMDLGFRPARIMNPEDHDEIISYTSQLTHAIAVSLINSDTQKYETGKYIGDSFRDLTRIANINENLWSELFLNNKEYLLESITHFEEKLSEMKKAIMDDDIETLKKNFIEATKRREAL